MFKLSGKLIFQPKRPSDFKKTNKLNTMIIELNKNSQLSDYYINRIQEVLGPWTNLVKPMFGLHITVLRGNGDRFHNDEFYKYNGQMIEVSIDPTSIERTPWSGENPAFWTMKIHSKQINEIRKNVVPIFPFIPHLTIARENPGFFMHSKDVENFEEVAIQCYNLIPLRGGNDTLRFELKRMIARMKVDYSINSRMLTNLIYKYVNFPKKEWEFKMLKLFGVK